MTQTINTTIATPIALSSMTDEQLCELHDRLGDEGMDALIATDGARQVRQDAAAKQVEVASPRVKTFDERREELAARCGKEFPHVAQALRGTMPPTEAVKVLNGALKNRAFGPEAADTLEHVRDLAIKAEVTEAKEAASRREAIVATQVTKVRAAVSAFYAHVKVGNIGGMEASMRQLHNAELQAGLIVHLGGLEPRDRFFASIEEAIILAKKAKTQPKAKGPKPERVGPKQSQRGTGKPRS